MRRTSLFFCLLLLAACAKGATSGVALREPSASMTQHTESTPSEPAAAARADDEESVAAPALLFQLESQIDLDLSRMGLSPLDDYRDGGPRDSKTFAADFSPKAQSTGDSDSPNNAGAGSPPPTAAPTRPVSVPPKDEVKKDKTPEKKGVEKSGEKKPDPDTCAKTCDLVDSICDAAERICQITQRLPNDPDAPKRCERAHNACERAQNQNNSCSCSS